MSNDIITLPAQLPAYLTQGGPTNEEFAGGLSQGFPLAFLSLRGKEFRFRKGGVEVPTRKRELPVVMVAARPSLSKRYYAEGYVSGRTDAPDCSSKNGVIPDVAAPQAESCQVCPHNVWGSGKDQNGNPTKGKACQDYKRLVVWAVGLHDEPVVVDLGPTSLKPPKDQRTNYTMYGPYVTALARHGLDPAKVVTVLEFTDAEYPQLSFRFDRLVTEQEYARVLDMRQHEDVQFVVNEDAHEEAAPIVEDSAPSQPAPQPAPVPEPTPAPAPQGQPAQPKPQQEPTQPELPGLGTAAEPAPPESTADEGSEDLLAAISKLLSSK